MGVPLTYMHLTKRNVLEKPYKDGFFYYYKLESGEKYFPKAVTIYTTDVGSARHCC